MNQQPEKDFNSATAVNNEDIKGLLKAAGLNEFYADVKSQDSNLKFEKSGSLFDLVRTNITGEKADIVSDIVGRAEVSEENKGDQSSIKETIEDEASKVPEIVDLEEFSENIDPINKMSDAQEIHSEGQEPATKLDEVGSVEVKELVDADNHRARSICETEEFIKELADVQADFDKKLKLEQGHIALTQSALVQAMDAFSDQIEAQISDFILKAASDLAGQTIDKMPKPLMKKIESTIEHICSNKDETTVHLNSKDYDLVVPLGSKSDVKIKFVSDKSLNRGEFEIFSQKASAKVLPLKPSGGD
tara:strand:+ start:4582 stop:5493 length:912 start_codon:yes stop_codon:yes gene_type:complete